MAQTEMEGPRPWSTGASHPGCAAKYRRAAILFVTTSGIDSDNQRASPTLLHLRDQSFRPREIGMAEGLNFAGCRTHLDAGEASTQ